MRALQIVFPKAGKVALRRVPVRPPSAGELLCRASVSIISAGTELACLRGRFDPGTNWAKWVRYPFAPGDGMAARVVRAGAGVRGFKPGDRIVCSAPHQEYFTVGARDVIRIPAAVTDEEAAWTSLAIAAKRGVSKAALLPGERAAVVGAGPLGELVLRHLRRVSAHPVPVFRRRTGGVERAASRLLDVVFEVSGQAGVLEESCRLLRPGGRVILLGDCPTPSLQRIGARVVADSLSILGVHTDGDFDPRRRRQNGEGFLRDLRGGRLSVKGLIELASPERAPQVYAALAKGRKRKTAMAFDWRRCE